MLGKFITVEGCEGVGKSTQLTLLKKYLEDTHQTATFTREPGGTDIAEKIRAILLATSTQISPTVEAYLFATARAEHLDKVIRPALARGEIVICDRFIDSSIAYQGYARGLGAETVMAINKFALADSMPDCTIFIDMQPSQSWRRQNGKTIDDDRLEHESEDFHNKVYLGFQELAANSQRIISVVPHNNKLVTHERIIQALKSKGLIN